MPTVAAFKMAVGAAVSQVIGHPVPSFTHGEPVAQELLVFFMPPRDIAGKHPQVTEYQQNKRQPIENPDPQKPADQQERNAQDQHRNVELI